MDPTTLIDRLRAALGERAVLTDPGDVAPYVTDWTGEFVGAAPAVLRPADTAAVAAAVRLCADAGVPLVPQGGNTGLVGGSVPDASGASVVLSLDRMRRVRDIDTGGRHDHGRGRSRAAARCRTRPRRRAGCSRSRWAPRARARSAATSRPTPAGRPCCGTG